jgi:glutaredoxin
MYRQFPKFSPKLFKQRPSSDILTHTMSKSPGKERTPLPDATNRNNAVMSRELVMYSRTTGCPFVTLAKRVLTDYEVSYREISIDKDPRAKQAVLEWTGFLSVPTLVVTRAGEFLPYEAPALLEKGTSPRGINRGAMITEPNIEQLTRWLCQHGFISERDLEAEEAS